LTPFARRAYYYFQETIIVTLRIMAGIFLVAYALMFLSVMGLLVALERSSNDTEGKQT
jgi:hypothetical protein